MIKDNWAIEYYTEYEAHMHKIKKVLLSTRTKFQKVEVVDTYFFGKCLFLDEKIQSSVADEFIYHEALVHPAMLSHPSPRQVLIIGGGEGATLREVLKYPLVEQVLMLDIDQELVELCQQYLPEMSKGAFKNPRAKVLFTEARQYLEKHSERFDLIIIDLPEPVEAGPAYLLYTQEFYQLISQKLNQPGLVVLQAGSTSCLHHEMFILILNTLKKIFPLTFGSQIFVPSFDMPWGLAFASHQIDPTALPSSKIKQKISAYKLSDLQYYDHQAHLKMFLLPKYLRKSQTSEKRVIRDNQPYFLSA
jgi:spermidine synthase